MNKTLALLAALGLVVSAPVFAADTTTTDAKADATEMKADAKADAKEKKADVKADAKLDKAETKAEKTKADAKIDADKTKTEAKAEHLKKTATDAAPSAGTTETK